MITLFHGSYAPVQKPLVKLGRKKVDFGQGFYLTKLRKQICILNQDIVDKYLSFTSFEILKKED